uniref:Uncharacterized protein n=1 Tax=Romanomermis culicivorax TaxID=13658 RepID=A0A915KRN4_ROMCU
MLTRNIGRNDSLLNAAFASLRYSPFRPLAQANYLSMMEEKRLRISKSVKIFGATRRTICIFPTKLMTLITNMLVVFHEIEYTIMLIRNMPVLSFFGAKVFRIRQFLWWVTLVNGPKKVPDQELPVPSKIGQVHDKDVF